MLVQNSKNHSRKMIKKIVMYSIGNSNESHGPAIPKDIDDHMARRVAITVARRTGFRYLGHLPYSGDKVGKIAKEWSAAYMDSDEFVEKIILHIKGDLRKFGIHTIDGVVIVSGHGGNNFLREKEVYLTKSIGIPICYIPPMENVSKVYDEKLGYVQIAHADIAEHSVAAYLGLLDRAKLEHMNKLAKRDPIKVLKRWPSIAGLGGYRLLGDSKYDVLRKSRARSLLPAKRFIKERRMAVSKKLGKRLHNRFIDIATKKALKFTR